MQHKKLEVIGIQMDMGASKRGVSMGPAAIRYGGLVDGLEKLGYEVHDLGDILPLPEGKSSPKLRNYEQVIDINKKLYHAVSEILERGSFPIVLGGDHSISAGSISAVAAHHKRIGVIWIDAHGDWNDEHSSPSGNMHGMSFSAVCGAGPDCMVDFGNGPVYVDPKNCVQIGGRDIDPEERIRMKESGITVFPINMIDKCGMDDIIHRAIAIASDGTDGIHLSFDVDAITPEYAPGTGTPVENGITAREAFLAVEMLAQSGKLISMDLVEVNPILDDKNKTGRMASELIQLALGKVVY